MKAIVNVFVIAGLVLVIPSTTPAGTIYWTPAHELAPQGYSSKMAAGDLDGNGCVDLMLFSFDPIYHYWNTGTPSAPAWELDLTVHGGVTYCSHRAGGLGDVDGDGDLDLAVGCYYEEHTRFYWNRGTPLVPAWELDMSLLSHITKFTSDTGPRFADMDADGDLDLLIGFGAGRVWYAANTGTQTSPLYTDVGWIGGIPYANGGRPSIAVGDLDGDGDLDIVRVTFDTQPECFENVGTPEQFEFVENSDMLEGVHTSRITGAAGVELVDIDADGDPDMILAVGIGDENLLFLNGGATPVERTSWGVIKAMYR
ncbi:VCBS repeat-containing protein [bacterium]|nr:VCBS repeat-containing protein [bacterium]